MPLLRVGQFERGRRECGLGLSLQAPNSYYGRGQRVWLLWRLSCGNAKLASPHLIAPVISPEVTYVF
jgi:hypothetical protein